jgi:PKD repeat protein
MFKKIWIYSVFICLNTTVFSQSRISYNEYFDYNRGYCEGDSQYDHWVDFLNALDTLSEKYTYITISGSYDMKGKSCADKYAVRQIADALVNRYDASVYCDGTYWNVGTGCSDFNCGSSDGYVELTLNSSTCNCGVSYTIRPGITSPNWGGVATETCQWSAQNASQRMRVDIGKINGNDNLALKSLVPFDECQMTQQISALVANDGVNKINDYKVGFSINGVLQSPVTVYQDIPSDGLDRILLSTSFTFAANTSYDFKVWTYDPNNNSDSETDNDTFSLTYVHTGHPPVPNASGVTVCGVGRVVLQAGATDSIAWYDVPDGGRALAVGANFQTPFLRRTDTFYAETFRFKESNARLGTGFNNYTTLSGDPSQYNGGVLDVAAKEVLHISGIKIQSLFANPTPHYKVYVRERGSTGAITDSTGWKRVFDAELTNGGQYNTIPVSILLRPGIDYGIYITTDPANGDDVWMNYGAYTYSNNELSVTGGTVVYGKFGSIGVYEPWTLDAEFIYETACRSESRQAVKVVVNPKPYGSELQPVNASVFYRAGTQADPDIAEPGLTMNYSMSNPSGYDHAGHGNTWEIDSLSVTGNGGKPIDPSRYTFAYPDAASVGKFGFTADSGLVDSTVIVRIRYRDLGPYFCDTIITRVIHVAPIPVPAFKVLATICEGSEIYFNNLSSIHSGRMSYKWFFSATDSSDIFEPVHQFDSFGVYPVRLEVSSIPYGIKRDTVILVNINNNPKVDFAVSNVCQGQALRFTNLTTGGGSIVSYTWDFGDRTPFSSVYSPSHLYTVPDVYRVTLTADLNGCVSSVTKNAYLFAKPVVSFTGPPVPICRNEPADFVNHSTIANGLMGALWDFGDSTYATLFNASHQFPNAGAYTVRLKMISEFGCEDSMRQAIELKPTPEADFTTDRLCSHDTTHFINLSIEFPGISSSYTWTFSEGLPQNSRHVSKSWTSYGPKTVVLKSELSNGCSSRIERLIDVRIQPAAAFQVKNICSEDIADFVNLSRIEQGAVSYYWDFGDQQTSLEDHPKHLYRADTTTWFKVRLVADVEAGCPDTAETKIRVYRLPSCNFTYKPFQAIGNRAFVFIPADNSSTEYEWFFGEGGSSNSPSPIYQFLYSGNYDVRLKAKNAGGCICEQLIKVNVFMSGIDDAKLAGLSMYPNPADESVTISLQAGEQGTAYLYNDLGQCIQIVEVNNSAVLPTASFKPGLYVVELRMADGKKSTARFSIIH